MHLSCNYIFQCLAAGSSILNREVESASMRPLARALTKNLDSLRNVLREQCLKSVNEYTERVRLSGFYPPLVLQMPHVHHHVPDSKYLRITNKMLLK